MPWFIRSVRVYCAFFLAVQELRREQNDYPISRNSPSFRKAEASLMFVVQVWSLHELGWTWVSVVSYVLFLCSAGELHKVRHSILSAGDGTQGLHHPGLHHRSLAQQLPTDVRYERWWPWALQDTPKSLHASGIWINTCLLPFQVTWGGKSRITWMKSGLLLPGISVSLVGRVVGCCQPWRCSPCQVQV